ncbi:hypothetical protein Hanom_Chr06g00553971 [Helianthus anomalus]
MINKRAVTIFSLSIIMFMMIKDCDGWMAPSNSSCGAAECQVFEDDDLEFMMDIEVYRRILGGGSEPDIYITQMKETPACFGKCDGRYTGGNGPPYCPGTSC